MRLRETECRKTNVSTRDFDWTEQVDNKGKATDWNLYPGTKFV